MSELCDIFNLTPATEDKKMKKVEKDINNLAVKFMTDPTERNFELLMRRVNWGLRSFMFKILQNDEAVNDCMSRTMENIYFRRDSFNLSKGKFSTWMYKVAYNNCLKYLNDDFGYNMPNTIPQDFSDLYESCLESEDIGGQGSSIDTEFMDSFDVLYSEGKYVTYCKEKIMSDIYDASVTCINKLPDNLRIVLKERYINKKKVDDIAYDNKIPVSSVKNWLRKGVVALNEELKESVPELYEMYLGLDNKQK